MNTSKRSSRPSEHVQFTTHDGIVIRGEAWGNPEADPVVFLHGGGQTRNAWGRTAEALAATGWRAVCLDARGHGDSDWAPDGSYSLQNFTQDLHLAVESFGRRAAVVGASLGGITALLAEERYGPSWLAQMVLVDITPRTEPEGVERIINFMKSRPDGFASVEEAAETVAGYLPHRRRPSDVSGLRRNLRQDESGRYRWHWDPRILDAGNLGRPVGDKIDNDPLVEAARSISIPTLLVRGGLSDIVSPEGVREFLALVPHAEYVDVSDAGHMVAGDSNDVFTEAVTSFLERSRG